MKVIYNPIDLKYINTIESLPSFFDKNMFNIVTIGRLDSGKNHSLLINSIKKLNNPKFKLYIFGEGKLKNELKILIEKYNLKQHVFLMGYESNPYKYLKAADLFVFSSNHEGFPNVLLEAMACHLPILATNCKSGPSEIMQLELEQNNLMFTNYGILVPIKDINLMADGIEYMYSNKEYLKHCKINVSNRIKDFKKTNILKEYIKVISQVT